MELSGSKSEFFSFFHSGTEGIGITIGTEELSGLSSDSKPFEIVSWSSHNFEESTNEDSDFWSCFSHSPFAWSPTSS